MLAAYDGRCVGGGRVLVDPTWHHWFNINLVGFVNASHPTHPSYDPTVVPKWEAIEAFFRNVPLWLASAERQSCVRSTVWLSVRTYVDVRIAHREHETASEPLAYFWQLRLFARDAFDLLFPRCQSMGWALDLLDWLDFRIDPWRQADETRPEPPAWLDLESFETVALGGAVHALVEEFGASRDRSRGKSTR